MPVLFGGLLVLVGLLIIWQPNLVAYVIASAFILAGVGVLMAGLGVRSNVTYRRIDVTSQRSDDVDG